MVTKLSRSFPSRLTIDEFLNNLTRLGRELKVAPESLELKESFGSLLANFKDFSAHYCSNRACIVSTVHWANLVGEPDPELWRLLKVESVKNLCLLDSKGLAIVLEGLAERVDPQTKTDLINEVWKKAKTLDQRSLMSIGKSFKVDFFGQSVPSEFPNPIRLLVYLQTLSPGPETEGKGDELSDIFLGLLPNCTPQVFCNILNEFNRLHILPNNSALRQIEQKAANVAFQLKIKDYNYILKAFNHPTFFGRISTEFFEAFELKLLKDLPKLPKAFLLKCIVKYGFRSKRVVGEALQMWSQEVTRTGLASTFREGFYAAVQTDLMPKELVQWSLKTMSELLPEMTPFDLVACLRALTVKELYNPSLLRDLIARIFGSFAELNDETRSVLYVTLRALEIDMPDLATELLVPYEEYRQAIREMHFSRRLTYNSYSQQQLSELLKSIGLEFQEQVMVGDLYETDYIFPERKVIVEMMGWPYHTNQYGGELRETTKLKLRHLNKLGWHVICVMSWRDAGNRLPEAILALSPEAPYRTVMLE
jgi:very-short-patch-repair endonuclease